MKSEYFVRTILFVAGLAAAIVGIGIALAPDVFYASYQMLLPDGATVRSELRGIGGFLAVSGITIFSGAVWLSQRAFALRLGILLNGGIVLGRLLSFAVDGAPSSPMLSAWTFEVATFVLLLGAVALNSTSQNKNLRAA